MQKAAMANWRSGFSEEPTAREMLAAVQEMHPAAGGWLFRRAGAGVADGQLTC